MKSTLHHLLTLALICSVWTFPSCGNSHKTTDGLEGKIIYDLTYPYEKSSVLMDLYPKEMVIYFKEDRMHSEIKSSYDLLTTDFIVDNDTKTFVQLLKNVSKRTGMKLDEDQTRAWYSKYPEYVFQPADETLVICGYVCKKTIAKAPNTNLPPVEIYYTRGLGLSNSNWWNPYNGIEGFLMGYDVDQYGMCMRLRAREITFEPVDESQFQIPENYEMIEASLMNQQLNEVVEEFVH